MTLNNVTGHDFNTLNMTHALSLWSSHTNSSQLQYILHPYGGTCNDDMFAVPTAQPHFWTLQLKRVLPHIAGPKLTHFLSLPEPTRRCTNNMPPGGTSHNKENCG
jgi:hypothetical protein